MPTYEYMCEDCGHEFELFQSITARPVRKCPSCGKAGARRLIGTGAAVIFKGSGFYETDYRSKSYKEAEKKEKDTKDKSDTKKKADTKDSKTSDKSKKEAKGKKKPA